ncbi:MAG: hypothetical protein N4A71_05735 [Carboxylicivirga sp.]|jgi:uncharacterized membrane protein YuzA (DUF378 family)|nr:hypothetical protein [Carboxylicivirga sp.]
MTEYQPTADEKKEFEKHDVHFKTLFKIYGGFYGFITSIYFWFALVCSVFFILINSFLLGIEEFELINKVVGVLLSTFPSILGFNIGAYALVIGFGDKSVLDKIRESEGENGYSLFQTIGGTFAVSVLIQSFTFMIAFLVNLFTESFGDLNALNLSYSTISSFNRIIAFIVLFSALYSVALIPKIVLNVFSFSQLYHFFSKN